MRAFRDIFQVFFFLLFFYIYFQVFPVVDYFFLAASPPFTSYFFPLPLPFLHFFLNSDSEALAYCNFFQPLIYNPQVLNCILGLSVVIVHWPIHRIIIGLCTQCCENLASSPWTTFFRVFSLPVEGWLFLLTMQFIIVSSHTFQVEQ